MTLHRCVVTSKLGKRGDIVDVSGEYARGLRAAGICVELEQEPVKPQKKGGRKPKDAEPQVTQEAKNDVSDLPAN